MMADEKVEATVEWECVECQAQFTHPPTLLGFDDETWVRFVGQDVVLEFCSQHCADELWYDLYAK